MSKVQTTVTVAVRLQLPSSGYSQKQLIEYIESSLATGGNEAFPKLITTKITNKETAYA